MIGHIPLKFREVHGSPGTENIIAATPTNKIFYDFPERLPLSLKLLHCRMGYLRNDIVHLLIHCWKNQTVKFRYFFKFFIQFNSTNFKYFKRKVIHRRFLPRGALVPL